MTHFDCFNGDADGICALTQLRLADPRESTLITGVKRDISLVERVTAVLGDSLSVLDVSLDKNRDAILRVLENGAEVFYCDHHFAGELPRHDKFKALINTKPDVCTSLLINGHLQGKYLAWAVVGTFGDNLKDSAIKLAAPLNLTEATLARLENLGIYLNYNGYGSALEDLYFHPADLFRKVSQHASPQAFISEDPETFATLENGYHADMQNAAASTPDVEEEHAAVYQLPNAAWARRVSGVFGNDLANRYPRRAHAVLTERKDGQFVVSVRAPLNNKQGADEICRQFESGGGRAAAAGVNQLPATDVTRFTELFSSYYSA